VGVLDNHNNLYKVKKEQLIKMKEYDCPNNLSALETHFESSQGTIRACFGVSMTLRLYKHICESCEYYVVNMREDIEKISLNNKL
jgi:hypothetical protein